MADSPDTTTFRRGPNCPAYIHGMKGTKAWRAWMSMRHRVKNPTIRSADRYIARGIKVCPEWDGSFLAFLRDMGNPPGEEYSLDRIDNNGNYEPGNCRWATDQQQNRNKSDNVVIEWNGRKMLLLEACAAAGIPYKTAWYRIQRAKWPVEKAMTTPVARR